MQNESSEPEPLTTGSELGRRVLDCFREMGVEKVEVLAHGTEEDFCAELGFKRARGVVAMQLDLKAMAMCQAGN